MAVIRGTSKKIPAYLNHIRGIPCLVCLNVAEAHHLMITGGRGMGMKAGDDKAVPLCHRHHMMLHAMGNEYKFWELHEVDAVDWAEKEWEEWLGRQ